MWPFVERFSVLGGLRKLTVKGELNEEILQKLRAGLIRKDGVFKALP